MCKMSNLLVVLALLCVANMSTWPTCADDGSGEADGFRTALQNGDYPWYDAANDRANWVEPPRQPADWSWLTSALQILAMASVLGVVIWLASIMLRFRRTLRPAAPVPAPIPTASETPAVAQLVGVPELPDISAQQLAAEGRYGMAVIRLFNDQLTALATQRRLHLRSGLTNGQYIRQLSGQDQTLFQEAVLLFERTLFGGVATTNDDYDRMQELTQLLIQEHQ